MPPDAGPQLYDGRAAVYDAVVGSRLYNRMVWGNAPSDYATFAARALSESEGWLLDAGGGSLLFTARAYGRSRRRILVLDQSLAMLRRARRRLMKTGRTKGASAEAHVTFIQADLRDLAPIRPASMSTILCLNVVHHIVDAKAMFATLSTLAAPNARLHLTSLVIAGRPADWYLRQLERRGGFAPVRSPNDVLGALEAAGVSIIETRVRGSMLYVVCERRPTNRAADVESASPRST